jgi:preprotein translocase subunit SecY
MQFWETTKPGFAQDTPVPFKRRVLYTLGLVLVFRLLALVPLFNVEEEKMHQLLADNPLIGALDLFAGGDVLTSFSLVAAGIFPYLLALGLMKAATRILRPLRALEQKGESGKKKLERITKFLTIPLAFAFAWGITHYFARETGLFPGKIRWFTSSSFLSTFGVVSAMTLGSLVTMGITTLITKKGIGSGESVLLIVGSVLGVFEQVAKILSDSPATRAAARVLAIEGVVALVVLGLSYSLIKAERRIPVRSMKNPKYTGNFLPLLANHGGVLPITSAVGLIAILKFGETFLASHYPTQFLSLQHALVSLTEPVHLAYWIMLAALVVLLTYAHNFAVLWKPFADSDVTLTHDLRKQGFFIPDIRPGSETEEYLSSIARQLSFIGAVTLTLLAVAVPYAVLRFTGQNVFVIVLAVFIFVQTLKTLSPEIAVHRIEGQYDGFLKKGKA